MYETCSFDRCRRGVEVGKIAQPEITIIQLLSPCMWRSTVGAKFCTCEEGEGGENAIPNDSDDDDDDCDIGFVFSLSLCVTAARSSADMAAETGVAAACLGAGGGSVPFASVVSISEKCIFRHWIRRGCDMVICPAVM